MYKSLVQSILRSLLRAQIVIIGNSKWVKVIIFVLNYLTVLVFE